MRLPNPQKLLFTWYFLKQKIAHTTLKPKQLKFYDFLYMVEKSFIYTYLSDSIGFIWVGKLKQK